MTITFKDASTPPKKTRPLTYGDLKPGDVFRFEGRTDMALKTDPAHVFFVNGWRAPIANGGLPVRRIHVTATIDRVESEVEE